MTAWPTMGELRKKTCTFEHCSGATIRQSKREGRTEIPSVSKRVAAVATRETMSLASSILDPFSSNAGATDTVASNLQPGTLAEKKANARQLTHRPRVIHQQHDVKQREPCKVHRNLHRQVPLVRDASEGAGLGDPAGEGFECAWRVEGVDVLWARVREMLSVNIAGRREVRRELADLVLHCLLQDAQDVVAVGSWSVASVRSSVAILRRRRCVLLLGRNVAWMIACMDRRA